MLVWRLLTAIFAWWCLALAAPGAVRQLGLHADDFSAPGSGPCTAPCLADYLLLPIPSGSALSAESARSISGLGPSASSPPLILADVPDLHALQGLRQTGAIGPDAGSPACKLRRGSSGGPRAP
ncbi:MAG: hypothetical protein EA402_03445 [Planctomycetota bacterium]|nr:MAG: hypothetical protein EA402_03445 [Planctomycetota bacterium]